MQSDCRTVQLGELVEVKHGWPFKSELFSAELTGKGIVVAIGNFRYTGGFRFSETTCKEYRGAYPKEYELSPGDILLVMTCQTSGGEILGIPARVPNDGRLYLHNQRIGKVVLKSSCVRPDFLYWVFLTPEFNRALVSSASGTKILHTAPTRICNYRFCLPTLAVQKEVAQTLDALQERIDLLRQTNATLEAVAQSLFKSWFIDFDPARAKAEGREPEGMDAATAALFPAEFEESALGLIPKGWRVSTLAEHVSAERGLSYKGAGLCDAGEGVPMHNLNSVLEGGGYKYAGLKHYSGDFKDRHTVNGGEVIVANTEQGHEHRLIGFPAIVPMRYERAIFSHHIYRVRLRPDSPLTVHTLYFMLMAPAIREQVIGCANGSTVNMLKVAGLEIPQFVCPPREVARAFEVIARPLRRQAEANVERINALTELRDTLLPRLISGKLRLPEARERVEDALA